MWAYNRRFVREDDRETLLQKEFKTPDPFVPLFDPAATGSPAVFGSNSITKSWFLDRPYRKDNVLGNTWTIDVCAVLEDPSTTPATQIIEGGVEFIWQDVKGGAVLTTTTKPAAPAKNAVYEKPAPGELGEGDSVTLPAEKPDSVFLAAMKTWNPDWFPK